MNQNKNNLSALTLQNVRDRVEHAIREAYNQNENVLLEALPVSGKSYSAITVADETETPLLYLASRNYLKRDAEDLCESLGLDYKRIPTPHNHCPAFNINNQEHYDIRAVKAYEKGVGGRTIHDRIDNIGCGGKCEYIDLIDFDPSAPDVLIGDPSHAYRDEYLEDRFVVKDEFSAGKFETSFENPGQIVNSFIQATTFPLSSYQDVVELSSDQNIEPLCWFMEHGLYQDTRNVLKSPQQEYHALAPVITFAIMQMDALDDAWESALLGPLAVVFDIDLNSINSNAVCVRDIYEDTIYLLNPPEFEIADGFLGLDGTPTPRMWKRATGIDLTHRDILQDSEKQKYISEILNYDIILTNDDVKPYQSNRNKNITPQKDTRIANSIHYREQENPGLITSKKAIEDVYPQYNNGEIFNYVDSYQNFGNVLSYRGFKDKHLGFVSGSRHYGDKYIERWSAYHYDSTSSNGNRGKKRSCGKADIFYEHMKRQTLQDVFRFGRDTLPTKVYVNTSALPQWVPDKNVQIITLSEDDRKVANYLQNSTKGGTINEIANKTNVNKRNARKKCEKLAEKGILNKLDDTPYPTMYVWDGWR
jgi:hypothetical protein